jgi:hypothetical protein
MLVLFGLLLPGTLNPEIQIFTHFVKYIRLPEICENLEFDIREFGQCSFGMPTIPKIGNQFVGNV